MPEPDGKTIVILPVAIRGMNVFFTLQTQVTPNAWEHAFVPAIRGHFAAAPGSRYRWVDDPVAADLIVLLESNHFRTQRAIPSLLAEPVLRDFPDKTFTINYEDHPAGFLPGLYAALPAGKFDPARHGSWCYLFPPNPEVYKSAVLPVDERCDLLFSFRGAESYPVRRRLFDLPLAPEMRGRITRIDRWFNHDPGEQQDYVEEIRRSRFVLCPRGLAPASHRLFEVMALGRCPVIIGDEWVAPDAVDWSRCALRVPEADVESLPGLLKQREPEAAELGRQARAAWEQCFSPGRKFEAALDALVKLRDARPGNYDERAYQARWNSPVFRHLNGWTLPQRVSRKASQLWSSLRQRLPGA